MTRTELEAHGYVFQHAFGDGYLEVHVYKNAWGGIHASHEAAVEAANVHYVKNKLEPGYDLKDMP